MNRSHVVILFEWELRFLQMGHNWFDEYCSDRMVFYWGWNETNRMSKLDRRFAG